MEHVADVHGLPSAIRVDNGPEFISKDLDLWAYWNKVKLDFSRPGQLVPMRWTDSGVE